MQDAAKNIESVAEQIDALKAIAQIAVPSAPLVIAYLQAALDTLAAHGSVSVTTHPLDTVQSSASSEASPRPRPRDPLDGLGGGNLLE